MKWIRRQMTRITRSYPHHHLSEYLCIQLDETVLVTLTLRIGFLVGVAGVDEAGG